MGVCSIDEEKTKNKNKNIILANPDVFDHPPIDNKIIPEKNISEIISIEQNITTENPILDIEKPLRIISNEPNEEDDIEPMQNYENTKTIKGHDNKVVSLIRLNSGYIATGSYDFSIKIWDIDKEPEDSLISIKHSLGFIICLLELKPNELLAGNNINLIEEFDLNDDSEEAKKIIPEHNLWVTSLVKCDENNFASASNDARIIIWDSNIKKKWRELLGHTDCVLTLILLKNGKLCSGSADNHIIIWDWKSGKYLSKIKAHNELVKSICQFNEHIILTGGDDKKIKIFDMNLGKFDELEGHKYSIRTLCKIDDNFFASGSFDNNIKIWDFDKKKCIKTLRGHQANVICIIKYNDKLISCSNDGTIKIWEEI